MQSAAQLPEAFVVLGFAFYLQPMMMPLLHDMPPGPSGLAITSTAVKIVIIGGLLTVQLGAVQLASVQLVTVQLVNVQPITVQLASVQLVIVQIVMHAY